MQERPKHSLKEIRGSTLLFAAGALLWVSLFVFLSALVFTSIGCATHSTFVSDYEQTMRETPEWRASSHEFVFLVDGLTRTTLLEELQADRLPNLRAFFFGNSTRPPRIASAVAPVPSLTYPSIASWLTSSPVAAHGVFGNTIEANGMTYDFGSVVDRQEFSRRIGAATAFARLERAGQQTMNLSYITQVGASVQASLDPAVGIAAAQGRQIDLDERALAVLAETLGKRDPSQWPRFSWIHLVSFDSSAHLEGPQGGTPRENLRRIDAALKPVFEALSAAEKKGAKKGATIRVLFSADHGMVPVSRSVSLPSGWVPMGRAAFASKEVPFESIDDVATIKGVDWLVYRQDEKLVLIHEGRKARVILEKGECAGGWEVLVDGRCPDVARRPRDLSHAAWAGILEYFSAQDSPRALAFAGKDVTFESTGELGSHGGLTDEELHAPLLHRHWPGAREVTPVHELLSWMGATSGSPGSTADSLTVLNAAATGRVFGTKAPPAPPRPALEVTTRTFSEQFGQQSTSLALGARVGVRPRLSRHWTGIAEYGFLTTRPVLSAFEISHAVHVGGSYWLGEKTLVGFGAELAQLWAPHWSGVFEVDSRARVISMGDSDLIFGGNLGLVTEGAFRAGMELAWEHYFTYRDLGGFRLRLDQMRPGAIGTARGETVRNLFGLEVYYRFGG